MINLIKHHSIPQNAVVTVGSFDGIHQGHRKIIFRMKQLAQSCQGSTNLITFYPHPRKLLYQQSLVHTLSSFQEKVMILALLGIENIYFIHFTKALSQFSADDFLKKIILRFLRPQHIVFGYDHAFGLQRKGNYEYIASLSKQYGFAVSKIEPREIGGKPVSSSRIRYALSIGSLPWVNRFLGRVYTMRGRVIAGEARGRSLGFPTANIQLDDQDKVLPPHGVYMVYASFPGQKTQRTVKGLLNIGTRPTFHSHAKLSLEVHLIDFSGNLYGKQMEIAFINYLRPEHFFNNAKQLMKQIHKDLDFAIHANWPVYQPITKPVKMPNLFRLGQYHITDD